MWSKQGILGSFLIFVVMISLSSSSPIQYEESHPTPDDFDELEPVILKNLTDFFSQHVNLTFNNFTNAYEKSKESTFDIFNTLKDKFNDAYEKAKEKAGNAYEKSKEKATDVYEKTKDKATDVYEKTKEKASDAYDKIKEKVHEAYDKIKDKNATVVIENAYDEVTAIVESELETPKVEE